MADAQCYRTKSEHNLDYLAESARQAHDRMSIGTDHAIRGGASFHPPRLTGAASRRLRRRIVRRPSNDDAILHGVIH
jgi:hypothetical protein